jgi:glycosyltransferase involved in cell wall biosynthesis
MASLLERADYVFYQSEFCRLSADRFARPAGRDWEVLHNPVDTSRFTPGPKPQSRRLLTLLLGGSQYQWYRLEAALKTLSCVVRRGIDAELLIAGSLRWTAERQVAERQAEELVRTLGLRDRVEFLGPYSQSSAPSLFRRADMLLHTKYNDPCPTVVLEAMSCGRPVVYSKSGGVSELVGEEAGVGIHADLDWEREVVPDPEAMADGVEKVNRNIAAFGASARERVVERFDVKRWLARHRQVFERLVS